MCWMDVILGMRDRVGINIWLMGVILSTKSPPVSRFTWALFHFTGAIYVHISGYHIYTYFTARLGLTAMLGLVVMLDQGLRLTWAHETKKQHQKHFSKCPAEKKFGPILTPARANRPSPPVYFRPWCVMVLHSRVLFLAGLVHNNEWVRLKVYIIGHEWFICFHICYRDMARYRTVKLNTI